MDMHIRAEAQADYAAIYAVHKAAFEQEDESRLVEAIRKAPSYIPELALVAIHADKVVGHIVYSGIAIVQGDDHFPCLALAPVAVLPEYQGKGIGGRLIEAGLQRAKAMGHRAVIVLGHPGYYPRFGFRKASEWGIQAPWKVPDAAFMALELGEGKLKGKSGVVVYPAAFDGV